MNLLESDRPVPPSLAIIGLLTLIGLVWLSAEISLVGLILLGLILLLTLLYVCLIKPVIWIYSVFLAAPFFMIFTSDEVSVLDAAFGLYTLGGLCIWFLYMILVKHHKILRTKTDWLFLLIYVTLPANFLISILNGGDALAWFREVSLFLFLLLYFPVREHINDKKQLTVLLSIYVIMVLTADLHQFNRYYNAVFSSDLKYAFQLTAAVKTNQTVLTSGSIFLIIFALFVQNRKLKLLLTILASITIIALAISFSRVFWIAFLFESIVIFFYLTRSQKVIYMRFTATIAIVVLIIGSTVYKDNIKYIFILAEEKLLSSTQGTRDISLYSRLMEWDKVVVDLVNNPLGGNGFGRKFSFFDPLSQQTTRTLFTHNAYLSISYKLGIPLAVCFFTVFFRNMLVSHKLARRLKDPFYRSIALFALMSMLMITISNLVTSTVLMRSGMWIYILSYAFTGIAERKYSKEKISDN